MADVAQEIQNAGKEIARAVERLATNTEVTDEQLAATIAAGIHAGSENTCADSAGKQAVETLTAIRRHLG